MKKGHLLMVLVGTALFGWVISHMRFSDALQEFKALRLAVPIVLATSLCRLTLQTTAWSQAVKAQRLSIPAGRLMGVRVASQSMGYLTVLGPVLSEPMKIKFLGTPAEPTITATALDDGVYWFTSTLVGIAGWLCLPLIAAHGVNGLWVASAIFALLLILFFIVHAKSLLFVLVRRLGNRSPRWLTRAAILESSIRGHRRQQPKIISRMFWIDVLCQLLIASEVVVVLWALRLPIHLLSVIAIEGITRGFKMVSGWIPARLGSDEGGAISAFALAGFSPVLGLALALTRRVRDLLWAVIGLSWLLWRSRNAIQREEVPAARPGAILKEAF